ncbi:MAG: YraN family protein [Patescibacteria group bacterium]|nr:YraN family protein [Patescibacteria group bacterium]MDD5715582.1 YraN family protein [Patescibacteria group bacterium]
MHVHRKRIGKWGEEYAVGYLQDRGYWVIARNWSARAGEADIIAFDTDEPCVVFVEVKVRVSKKFGTPEESIGERKKRALERVIAAYLRQHRYQGAVRVDVIAIERRADGDAVRHLKNVSLE